MTAAAEPASVRRKISLVLSDVDGTLLTKDKVLTDRARKAALALRDAGIRFAITSARPPKGLAMLFDALEIDTPVGGFNGGMIVMPDLAVLQQKSIEPDAAKSAIGLIQRGGIDCWLFDGNRWMITRPDGAHVAHESHTINYGPEIVADFDGALDRVSKVVGVSDDFTRVEDCETAIRKALGKRVTAMRSQAYYVDVTPLGADKGTVVDFLARYYAVPAAEIATIGDQHNDVAMFRRSGFSIAMGNAPDDVKTKASVSTDSNEEEGFAKALERHVLGKAI